jgi:hypothetical protein
MKNKAADLSTIVFTLILNIIGVRAWKFGI